MTEMFRTDYVQACVDQRDGINKAAMNAVELELMCVWIGLCQIVDRDDFYIGTGRFHNSPKYAASDPSKSVDCQLECHYTLRLNAVGEKLALTKSDCSESQEKPWSAPKSEPVKKIVELLAEKQQVLDAEKGTSSKPPRMRIPSQMAIWFVIGTPNESARSDNLNGQKCTSDVRKVSQGAP